MAGNWWQLQNESIKEAQRRYAQQQELERMNAANQSSANQAQQQQTIASLSAMADPFAAQRSKYQSQLSDLLGVGGGSAGVSTPQQPVQYANTLARGGFAPVSTGQATTAAAAPVASSGVDRLNQVMQSNPFFQASQDAAQDAGMRRLRAMGMGGSGNAAIELGKIAQQGMGDQYFKMADLLGRFSGANADPSSGANAALGVMNLQEKQRQFDFDNRRTNTVRGSSNPLTDRGPIGVGSNLGSYWGY